MPRRPFKKKKSSGGTNPFDDSAGSLSLGDPSDAADIVQEETLGLKLYDSAKLNETITSGSSEEDDDNDGNGNMRERLGSGDQQVEEEYGFSSIAGNGGGGGGGRTTADLADGLDTLDDALDDLDTEPLERGNKKRGLGRFSFLNTSNWTHPKYCWRRQAMSRLGKSHMKNGFGHDERRARRKMLLIVTAVVLVILVALAGSIAAWQVITKKNSEQQKMQDAGGDGGAIVIIPGGEDDLTPVVIEDDPSANATTINNTTIDLELDLDEDFDPTLNEVGEDENGIQVDCAKCEASCRPCLGCVDLFGTTEDCDQCEPCQVCMPCFSDGGGESGNENDQKGDEQGEDDGEREGPIDDGGNEDGTESATTIVEMSYLQSYTGIDLATLATEDQIDAFQTLMVALLDEYIERDMKDAVEVVCTYNTQRLTSYARRYRKHAGGASFHRMLRGRHLDTHGDSQQDESDAELQSLGLEKGASPHTHVVKDDTTPDPCDTPEKETCADMCTLNCNGDADALAVCHFECRHLCCLSKDLNGGGPDTGGESDPDDGDGSYDPWSNGLLCEDGTPPVRDDPSDPVGKCPTGAPTSQPSAVPSTADGGDICNTDDELTCKDICLQNCDTGASTYVDECSDQCKDVCCSVDDTKVNADGDLDPWSDPNGILCPDGSPVPLDGECPEAAPTLQPTPMSEEDPCDTADETTCRDMCVDACPAEADEDECLDDCREACCDVPEDAPKGDPWTSGQLCPDGSAPKRNLTNGDLRCDESSLRDGSFQPTIALVLNTPMPTIEPTAVPTGKDTPPPSRRPTPKPTPKPTLALQDECDVESGEKWCDATGECYKEWQTSCPTSASCSTDGDCLIRIGGCGPYACQCVLLGIDESPPVECSPDDSEPCMCAGCMEETCADVRAVCLEGVCAKEVTEVSVDASFSPTVEGPTPSPTMEALNVTDAPTDERPTPLPTGPPEDGLIEDLIMSEGESMKLEVDFTMAWIVSPDADQAVLDELPSIPNKFERWMNSIKGKKQIVRKFERKLDLIIEEVSDLTPRGMEDEQ